jgi:SAM-dependent methyltransferase
MLSKDLTTSVLRVSRFAWHRLPYRLLASRPIALYGDHLLALTRVQAARRSNFGTLFLRNRPQLELMRRLVAGQNARCSEVKMAVFGCSSGAEVYSILWTLRSARPDLKISMDAVDISWDILEFARIGVYQDAGSGRIRLTGTMSEKEIREFFDVEGEYLKVKPWLKEGITWRLGYAEDEKILDAMQGQDIVAANNFLCHMNPADAERCLRNIARSVKPGGYLFVSGIDLDVRTKVAVELRWEPVLELLEEMHEGDPYLREDWPFEYWGLEPLNKRRSDWRTRYASAFQL